MDRRRYFPCNSISCTIISLCFITMMAACFLHFNSDLKPSIPQSPNLATSTHLAMNPHTGNSNKSTHLAMNPHTSNESTHSKSGLGYMFALTFSDQGTGAFTNILSFLCFASKVGGVRIIEPFLVGSAVGTNCSANWKTQLKFSDTFDNNVVKKYALSRKYSPLVSFSDFLEDAPRNLLVAQYKCSGVSSCRPCGHEDVLEKGRIFSKLNGFEMVGHVCLDYGPTKKLTIKEVEETLYANYSKSEVVIMFTRFGGLESGTYSEKYGYRFFVSASSCYRKNVGDYSLIRPSQLAINSANKYLHEYLEGEHYISVMVRIEMIFRSKLRDKEGPQLTENCLNKLYDKIEEIRKRVGIKTVTLCLDVGRYGSNAFRNEKVMNPLLPSFDAFLSRTIKEGMTLSEWDNTFSNVSARQEPGFIAVMQKVIAARGDVLVTLGAESTFQTSVRQMYKTLHKKRNIITLDKSCGHEI